VGENFEPQTGGGVTGTAFPSLASYCDRAYQLATSSKSFAVLHCTQAMID